MPIKKRVVVEEQLRADPIRAALDLGLQVIHLEKSIWRCRMTLGKTRNTDSKGVAMAITEGANVRDQIRCVWELALACDVVSFGRVTTKGEHVMDADLGVPLENRIDFHFRVADAGEMRYRG